MNLKLKFLLVSFIFITFSLSNSVFANIYIEKTIDGHKIKVMKYELDSDKFTFKIGVNKDGEATGLRELMEKNNGISAVNGVYLCPSDYTECLGKNFTINERYVEGKKYGPYSDTGERVVFSLDKENKPFLFQTNKINPKKEKEIYNGLGNFPLLLKDGKNVIEHYREVGLIDKKMINKMNRNFICSDKDGKNLYFGYVYNIRLDYLHAVLSKIGCYNAINLDAGNTSAMIYNSRYIVGPGRNLLDSIIIERKGLDTKTLRDKSHTFISKIEERLRYRQIKYKTNYLNTLSDRLNKARKKIYELNSHDLFDENGKKIGYEIYANSIKTLRIIYIINYLDKLIYDRKIKYINENKRKGIDNEPMF